MNLKLFPIALLLCGCAPVTKPPPGERVQSYLEWQIAHGNVYRTNVVTTNEVWRAVNQEKGE